MIVLASSGEWAIRVRAIEVLLYIFFGKSLIVLSGSSEAVWSGSALIVKAFLAGN